MILFGSNRHFDLTNVPFSRAGAFLSVVENKEDHCLYLTHCRSEETGLKRPYLMKLSFLDLFGAELPFVYEADEAKLTVKAGAGSSAGAGAGSGAGLVEFTYDGAQVLRVRATGAKLRVAYEPEMHEGADIRPPDELEVGMNFIGKLLFKGITGHFHTDARWNFREVRPFPFVVELSPKGAAAGEMAIHEYYTSGRSYTTYRPFEDAEAETRADFESFAKAYPPVPDIYAEAARRCAWVVWMLQMGPRGSIKRRAVFMHKTFLVRAFGWQQAYAAIALADDARRGWEFMLSIFDFQDERGGIPDNFADVNQENWVSTKPPLFGYAVCYILDNYDTSSLTKDDVSAMYERLKLYRGWWYEHHDHAKTGFPSYYHVDESGYDESSLFYAGLPLQSPDLIAYMVLLNEALSKLAARMGDDEAAAAWEAESKRALAYLVDELWDGELFCAKVTRTGKLYKCGSAAHLQPVLLGARLPAAIIAKIRDRVLDESEFLTDYGITSENMKDPEFTTRSFTRGPVIAPVNMQIISGLFDAGETSAAMALARRYLNALLQYGPVLGSSPYRVDPAYGRIDAKFSENPIGAPMTAWAASVFLALAARYGQATEGNGNEKIKDNKNGMNRSDVTMDEVLELVKQVGVGYLATVEGRQPRVRAFGFGFYDDGKFWFSTTNTKKVSRQLKKNPFAEIMFSKPDFSTYVRISGRVVFDASLEAKSRVMDAMPAVKGMYKSPDNPIYEVFYIEKGEAAVDKFPPTEPTKIITF